MRKPLMVKISIGAAVAICATGIALSLSAEPPLVTSDAESSKINLDELPVLGFVTLGTTTFGQVAGELAAKRCTMAFWPKSMLTNYGCLGLPGKASINFEAQKTAQEEMEGRAHRVRHLDKNIIPLPVIEVWLNIEATHSNACTEYQKAFEKLKASTPSEVAVSGQNEAKSTWQLGDVNIEMRTIPNEGCTISYSLANKTPTSNTETQK